MDRLPPSTWEAPFEFIEIENEMVTAVVGRRGNRELVFHGYRVSAGREKKTLRLCGDGYTTVEMD